MVQQRLSVEQAELRRLVELEEQEQELLYLELLEREVLEVQVAQYM